LISRTITFRIRMLAAINFNDQLRLATGEIRDVWANRQLSSELGPIPGEQFPNLALLAGRA
jgi:hypothetical protein